MKSSSKGDFEMNVQNPPGIGDTLFLMHRKVVVTNVYLLFRLVSVHYLGDNKVFSVDICALSNDPVFENSISLGLIEGEV